MPLIIKLIIKGGCIMSSYDFLANIPSVGEVQWQQRSNRIKNETAMEEKRLRQEFACQEKERKERIIFEAYKYRMRLAIEAYKYRMRLAIESAIQELMNSSVKYSTTLNLSLKERLVATDYYGIDFHVVHYGGKPIMGPYGLEWKTRNPNPLFVGLFKELQTALFEYGYYLLDVSDPSKSHAFVVKLYLGKPVGYDNEPVLWHGLNKI
jgi:hypothetical protein